ncbi:MAG TPA: NADP-dependent oxidoreductase [Gaiellaceae bacterium]|nr:NADP-dependent oxidoreductase [Gaiellaceae bacterium]
MTIAGSSTTSAAGVSRELRLVARPTGVAGEELFELAEEPIPEPGEGQLLIRNAYFSVDPYMRPRTGEARAYVAPLTIGEAMTGGAVGRVVVSHRPDFAEGDWVLHLLGWREWALSDGSNAWKMDPGVAPVSTALGVLGVPGFTAYHGLYEIGKPRTGETVFVSGASGAVGSAAGQMAKIAGCRVVGCAGSPQKVEWLRELGFDVAFDYRERPVAESLAEAAPEGIDVYFDNVGGALLEAAIGAMRRGGRVVACGSMSRYVDDESTAPRNLFMVVTKRLRIEGFVISDHFDRFPAFLEKAQGWVREGRLRYRESVIEGIENAPGAFHDLLRGESIGKVLVKVGPVD